MRWEEEKKKAKKEGYKDVRLRRTGSETRVVTVKHGREGHVIDGVATDGPEGGQRLELLQALHARLDHERTRDEGVGGDPGQLVVGHPHEANGAHHVVHLLRLNLSVCMDVLAHQLVQCELIADNEIGMLEELQEEGRGEEAVVSIGDEVAEVLGNDGDALRSDVGKVKVKGTLDDDEGGVALDV